MNRRQFVGTLGAAALASRFSWAASAHRIERIGLELYTVRDALGKDFEGTLARVAKLGDLWKPMLATRGRVNLKKFM